MNTKLVAIVAAVVILIGAGGFLLYNKSKTSVPPTTQSSPTPAENTQKEMMGNSSISSLFSGGKTQKCTFNVKATNGGSTDGTVYVSANKAYGNFAMTDNGKSTNTYLIRNADTFYIWGGALPTGIKITMSVNDMAQKMQTSQSSFDPNQKVNFNCSAWNVDNSVFTPPTNIKFTDTSSVMQGSPNASGTGSGYSQCSACSYLSGSEKTDCLALYKCQ